MPTPKKAPTTGHATTPPKQTSHPSGGFQRPSGGGSPHPVDGSQDKGTKGPGSASAPKSPKMTAPTAKPSDGSQDKSRK